MTDDQEFTTDAAREAAGRDELAAWVGEFLASPGSDNAVLAQMLTEQPHSWIGPVQIPLDQLNRLAGPSGHPVVEEVDDDFWRDDVEDLAQRIRDGFEPAPVIAFREDDHLKLEDGNHRVEALRRAGHDEAWTIIGFSTEADRDRFIADSEAAAT